MYYLVYVSSATHPFSKDELLQLLQAARAKNQALGITGMLLYKDGNFMQVLEGERDKVQQLYATISADARHHGSIIIDEGESTLRQFGDWSMGFRDLTDPQLQSEPGFSKFLNQPITVESYGSQSGSCWELLNLFRIQR